MLQAATETSFSGGVFLAGLAPGSQTHAYPIPSFNWQMASNYSRFNGPVALFLFPTAINEDICNKRIADACCARLPGEMLFNVDLLADL